MNDRLRAVPSVHAVLERQGVRAIAAELGAAVTKQAVRDVVADARRLAAEGREPVWSEGDVRARAERLARGSLVPVLNGTGVVIHTNLGRAPIASEAMQAAARIATGYSSLEYEIEEGARGDRSSHVRALLALLTGAEDAIVVNNNAAAVLLVLGELAQGREVVVSRGELVEIGGGFRVPEVLAQSGARLVEVGTTNRTHARDYERAISADTALLLKVHRSNFEIVGFTSEVDIAQLADIAHARGLPLVYDAGSGALVDLVRGERTVRSCVEAGADVVTFSGDKLLGGPQAGLIVGRAELVARMRAHPLMRAFRQDKTCLAALHATLHLWATAPERIPLVRMLRATVEELAARAGRIAEALGPRARVVETTSRVGGGAAPSAELPSRAVRIEVGSVEELAAHLRRGTPAVLGRVEDGVLLVDLRAVNPNDDDTLLAALRAGLEAHG
jgi:L-seryl-tRNA(Ser) seleniumtransferase